MLSRSCRRFRARFSPQAAQSTTRSTGWLSGHRRHRAGCADCDAYAADLERLAAARLPLPPALLSALARLARPEAEQGPEATLPRPVPALPLPAALHSRLRAIPRERRERPPEWITSPRYAIAASLLLTVLSGALLGSPAQWAPRLAGFLGREVTPPIVEAEAEVKSRVQTVAGRELSSWRLSAQARWHDLRQGVGGSVAGLEHRVSGMAEQLRQVPQKLNFHHDRDQAGAPASRVRRTP